MPKFHAIEEKQLKKFDKNYENNKLAHAMTNALSKHSLNDIVFNPAGVSDAQFNFTINLKTLPATNQKASGRCWLFSALNVLRENIAKDLKLENFELSQNYIAFWDKYEKANYFFESIIDLADRPTEDRLVSYILAMGVQDGGQWDMFVNVINKHGIVPKAAMEETFQSSNTYPMNRLVNSKLRQGASAIRKAIANGATEEEVQKIKEDYLADLYNLFCMCFGQPPKKFDFEYTDKDGKYHIVEGLTPMKFYKKFVKIDVANDYISLVNSPTQDKPFHKPLTIDYLGNVVEGIPVKYLNIPMEELKTYIVKQLQAGEVVWFGSDVGRYGDREKGTWSDKCFDYNGTLGINFDLSKEDMLNYGDSAMNHAMVITGVKLDKNGKPTRWKIENSWGNTNGQAGYYLMSEKWFDSFVYQALINKKYLPQEIVDEYNSEPKHFMPWDPMGTLAD